MSNTFEIVKFTKQEILIFENVKEIIIKYNKIIKYIQISDKSICYEKKNGLINFIDNIKLNKNPERYNSEEVDEEVDNSEESDEIDEIVDEVDNCEKSDEIDDRMDEDSINKVTTVNNGFVINKRKIEVDFEKLKNKKSKKNHSSEKSEQFDEIVSEGEKEDDENFFINEKATADNIEEVVEESFNNETTAVEDEEENGDQMETVNKEATTDNSEVVEESFNDETTAVEDEEENDDPMETVNKEMTTDNSEVVDVDEEENGDPMETVNKEAITDNREVVEERFIIETTAVEVEEENGDPVNKEATTDNSEVAVDRETFLFPNSWAGEESNNVSLIENNSNLINTQLSQLALFDLEYNYNLLYNFGGPFPTTTDASDSSIIFDIPPLTNTANNMIFCNENNNTILSSKNRFNDVGSVLKKEILSTEDYSYEIFENCHLNEEVDLLSVLKNCVTSEIQLEVQNCITLMNYFRGGALLNKILECLKEELSEVPEQNIITGLLKGTGIIFSFNNSSRGKRSKKAWRFLNKCLRVHKVYENFPYPFAQICRSETLTANKLLNVGSGSKEDFEKFVQEIKDEIGSNIHKYNDGDVFNQHVKKYVNYIDFSLITKNILENVIKFSKNPSLET
jgi:hypothetical protein